VNFSGLVITLTADEPACKRLLSRLASDVRIDVGERQGPRLPITLEAPDLRAERTFWAEIYDHPAVVDVHVVYHHFGGDTEQDHREIRGPT